MKRFLSTLLVFTLILSCVPARPIQAQAVTEEQSAFDGRAALSDVYYQGDAAEGETPTRSYSEKKNATAYLSDEWLDSGVCIGTDCTWTLSKDGVLTVSGTGRMYDYINQDGAPWYMYTFFSRIKKIVISEGITHIGDNSFFCAMDAVELQLPSTLTSIGEGAFYSCTSLKSITLPRSVSKIGKQAFAYCSGLETADLRGVQTFGERAFESCSRLNTVALGSNVSSIGRMAFNNCNQLWHVFCGGNLNTISMDYLNEPLKNAACHNYTDGLLITPMHISTCKGTALHACQICSQIYYTGDLTENHSYENDVCIYCGKINEIIPEGLMYTIANNTATITGYEGTATQLKIPKTIHGYPVTAIGELAFLTSNLERIVLPDTITSIGKQAFYFCDCLVEIIIPDSVISIDSWAFENCDRLTSITIPDSVTSIGNNAFSWCDSLTSVTIGNSVTSIGDEVFYRCPSLTRITIGNSVTSISNFAFGYCSSLPSITIPASVASIGFGAFSDCVSLKDVYYTGSKAQWAGISIGVHNSYLENATIHYNHTHDYTLLPAVTVAPTCTEAGYIEYTCYYGDTYREYIQATGHTTESFVSASTCTEQGYTQDICTACGEIEKTVYVPALGHDYSVTVNVVAPTCTEQGYSVKQCSRCDVTKNTDFTDPAGHKGAVIPLQDATCTEQGITTAGTMCERCKEVFIQPTYTPALGHNMAVVSKKDPSCTEQGCTETKCTRCDIIEMVYTDAVGHHMVDIPVKDPTCTEQGVTKVGTMCDRCEEILAQPTYSPALGHDYVDGTCSRCQEVDPDYNANPGDLTGDNQTNNEDVVLLLWHTLFPLDYPLGVSGDINKDGEVNNEDVVLLLWHTLFPEDYPL